MSYYSHETEDKPHELLDTWIEEGALAFYGCTGEPDWNWVRSIELARECKRLRAGITAVALDAENKGFNALAGNLLLFRDGQIRTLTATGFDRALAGEAP